MNQHLNTLKAFLHAEVDGDIALVSAVRKSDRKPVVLACIRQSIELPPRVIGGAPELVEQTVPVFEFVDLTAAEVPYEAPPEVGHEAAAPSILLSDPHARVRMATEAERSVEPANAA